MPQRRFGTGVLDAIERSLKGNGDNGAAGDSGEEATPHELMCALGLESEGSVNG